MIRNFTINLPSVLPSRGAIGWIYLALIFGLLAMPDTPATGQSYQRPENNIWLNKAEGLDFNSGSPQATISSWQGFAHAHGSASVCDAQGNLLFYSDGNIVWDKNNDVMLNGWDINNNGSMVPNTFYIEPTFGSSSYNFDGVVIIPMPGSSHKYYIFSVPSLLTENSFGIYTDTWDGKLFGSIVDMELNSGLGGVDPEFRGVQIADELAGNLHSVTGENCNTWLLGFGSNGSYKAFNITSDGVNTEPVVSTLTPPLSQQVSEFTLSPDRRKAAMAYNIEVQVSDFDPATGQFSNDILIGGQETRYVAFAPNSHYIYFSGLIGLRQYDLNDLSTPFTLLTFNNLTDYEYNAPLRLAPDGKIYLSYYTAIPGGSESVGAHIQQPDVFGTGCQMELIQGVSLPLLENDWVVDYVFPNEIPVVIYDTTSTVKEVPLCFNQPTRLFPEDTMGSDYHWMVNTIGTTYIRHGDDTTRTLMATAPGTYAVQYYSSDPCTFHQDTFIVKGVSFSLYLGPDRMSCDGSPIELEAGVPGGTCLWPDGSTGNSYEAAASGTHWVAVSKGGCTATDSINISIIDIAQDLGEDTTLCYENAGAHITLTANLSPGATALWSTGSTEAAIQVSDSGLYWVQVSNKECMGTDSIYLQRQYCTCPMMFPTAFSPNGDGVNDEYLPALSPACPVAEFKMQVYNRWGQLLFISYEADKGWDGTYNGQAADVGTYFYQLQMKTGISQVATIKQGDFVLIR